MSTKYNNPLFRLFTGHSALPEDNKQLSCNTEKDRHIRLNHRTAGMMLEFALLWIVCPFKAYI